MLVACNSKIKKKTLRVSILKLEIWLESCLTTRTNLDKFYHDLNEWLMTATKTLHDGSKTCEN